SSSAPVESGHSESFQLQGIGKIDDILPDRRLLRHAWRSRIAETRRAKSTQIRHEDTITSFYQRRRHVIPGMDVVRETVKENDRHSSGISTLSIANIKNRRRSRFYVVR